MTDQKTIETVNDLKLMSYLSLKAAKIYMHAMVFSHMSYCVIVCSLSIDY